jgi:hypothetical protein
VFRGRWPRRRANDDTLLNHGKRIKARAVDRAGELLKEIPPAPGARTDLEPSAAAGTRFEAAREAGLSRRQTVTAIRVNNVPRPQFGRAPHPAA